MIAVATAIQHNSSKQQPGPTPYGAFGLVPPPMGGLDWVHPPYGGFGLVAPSPHEIWPRYGVLAWEEFLNLGV